jgi:hypothetical protein
MKDWIRDSKISRVIAKAILPSEKTTVIKAGTEQQLKPILGDTTNLAAIHDITTRAVDVTTIKPLNDDVVLAEVPIDLKPIKDLVPKKDFVHGVVNSILSDGYEFRPEDDYLLMSVYENRGGGLVSGYPTKLALSIESKHFREIAKDMMLRLASSHQGAEIFDASEVKDYRHSFAKPKDGSASENYSMLWRIVANAGFSDRDIAEIAEVARRTENYEFFTALKAAYKQTEQAASIRR